MEKFLIFSTDLVSCRFIINNLFFRFYIFSHYTKILYSNYDKRTLTETELINIELLYNFIQGSIRIVTCN